MIHTITRRLFALAIMLIVGTRLFCQEMSGNNAVVHFSVDGAEKRHAIDGIGINANTRSWNNSELVPAIDLLADSMHAVIWRVIVETVENWEEVNDNGDPFTFNWIYYNQLYETPKFQRAWDMIRYLNNHGIAEKLMINFMGAIPKWMGGEVVKPEYEDEYIEMLVSFFYYARNVKHLKFGLISLMNEPDIRKEGPTVGPEQYVRLQKKLMVRMKDAGLGDVRYVAPDVADMHKGILNYIPLLMKDPDVMAGIAHFGLHSYGGYYAPVDSSLRASPYPNTSFWMTEWNAWCNGCDDGILGEYNYVFAAKCVGYLLDILKNGATGAIAWEGYDSYYEHHAPSTFSYWGMLAYDPATRSYHPRKNFYAIQQVSRFVAPGSFIIPLTDPDDSLSLLAFYDTAAQKVNIVGINKRHRPVTLEGTFSHLPAMTQFALFYTDEKDNLRALTNITVGAHTCQTTIPADCIFTLCGSAPGDRQAAKTRTGPEPAGWYAGDIHVHLNCGDEKVLPEEKLLDMMKPNDLAVISVLADMGNGEVKYSEKDLPKVDGQDARQSTDGRIVHWDAEWHWDATYSQFSKQALGGHLVLLGLKNARQLWQESPYRVLEWGREQGAVGGFAHFQYLNDKIQDTLNCCIPVDYPVEAALGTIDFISEDVYGSISQNNGNYNSEAAINAYYKLLNCGFRIGLAAGTDYPCNNNEPLGTLLTYSNVRGDLTYTKWITGIKQGRTVVSRNGHDEFLDLKVNGTYGPGDDIKIPDKRSVDIALTWTGSKAFTGRVELICNGRVFASQTGTVRPGEPMLYRTKLVISKSSWICARRMAENGHQLHTSPIYVTVNKKPIRASARDARYFIGWIDNILKKTKKGGEWSGYFPTSLGAIRQRYQKARSVYEKIATECELPARYPPILILSLDKGYGNFTGELLKTEGLHAYRIEPLTKGTTLEHLQNFNVVIVTAGALSRELRQLLSAYVREGGNLIAFRPDKGLSSIFGIRDQADSIGESYVRIDGSGGIAKGITSQTLQFHGMADEYLTVTATRVATLYKDAHTVTAYPAVVANRYGKGHAIAFLYNLPLSIAATRQGNYRNAGREMDGITGIRAMDMFTDGWVDTSKNTLNQADEQMRLLTRCIEWMVGFREPLPRFWYFPDTLKCLVTLNNDGEDNKEDEFEEQFKDIAAKGAKMTLYIKELDSVSKKWIDAWSARGFEIAGHYNDTKQAVNPDWRTMDSVYKNLNGKLKNIYGIQRILTVVNHWFVWCGTDETGRRDFSAQARIEELNGIRLDCNYAHYDNGSPQGHFLGPLGTRQGNYTGSGLPMKFADLQGDVIDIYQQLNNVYDQQYMEHNDKEGFYDCFKGLMDRSLEDEVYSFVCIKAHNAEYFFSKEPLMHMLDYANSKGIPVWTELELLDFEKARDEAAFIGLHWVRDKLTFTIKSSVAAAHDITCMIPYRYMGKRVDKVTQNGVTRSWLIKKVKGAEYAWLTIRPGTDYKVEVRYK